MKSFLKSILQSNENDDMKFQFRFALNARSSPAFGQRTSADQLAQLSAAPMTGFFSWRGLKQSALEVHGFSAGMQRRDAFHFVFKRRYRYSVRSHMLGERHKRMFLSDLRFFLLHVVELGVSVQPCTPKVLPNTETFLHSRVFFVTCVVPALCQIMYSLLVCSDGTKKNPLANRKIQEPLALKRKILAGTFNRRPGEVGKK